MFPTWTRRSVFFGLLFSFSSSGAAFLSAICFISSRLGMCPAIPFAGGAAWALAVGCAGTEGDCEPRNRYPIANPTARQIIAIAYTCVAFHAVPAVDGTVGPCVMPDSPLLTLPI